MKNRYFDVIGRRKMPKDIHRQNLANIVKKFYVHGRPSAINCQKYQKLPKNVQRRQSMLLFCLLMNCNR